MVSLVGMVDATFGSFICFRGFASFSVLAKASQADSNYQRIADDCHIQELRDFLTSNVEGRFFPEIIIGTSWKKCGIDDAISIDTLLHSQEQKKRKVFKGDGVSFTVGRPIFRRGTTRACIFRLDDKMIQKKPFYIIDGNHRLQALPLEGAKTGSEYPADIYNQKIPFCLVLFLNDYQYKRNGAIFFHNINYRAVPIPEEKNLSIILNGIANGEYLFTDEVLKHKGVFGLPYYYARKAIETGIFDVSPRLMNAVSGENKTFLVDVLKVFINAQHGNLDDIDILGKLRKALSWVELALEKSPELLRYKRSMLEALVCYCMFGKDGDGYVKWLLKNQLSDVVNVMPRDVISIFERTHERGPYKVFVAMPYISHKRINDCNKLFGEVLDDLSKNGTDGVKYELIPIMRFRGASQRIDQRLIKCIRDCDIFIADITGNNENVIFEVGLSEGANKPMLLIKQENDSKSDKVFTKCEGCIKNNGQPPFDMDKLQYIPYSSTGYYNDIKGIVKRHLPVIANELLESKTSKKS